MERVVVALFFLLAIYGLANAIAVLKFGRYFLGTVNNRKFIGRIPFIGDLFYCPPCLAFWIGMAASAWVYSPTAGLVLSGWRTVLTDGLAASAFAYFLHMANERMGHGLDV